MEQTKVHKWANEGPINVRFGQLTRPEVEGDPDALLRRKIGVPAILKQPGSIEAAIKILTFVAFWDLGVLSILFASVVKICRSLSQRRLEKFDNLLAYSTAADRPRPRG